MRINISRHVNCLSRVVNVPAPTPVTTSYRCCVPHLLVGSVAVQCQSVTSFITQASSKPSLDLFPRKCTYVEVIDLRIMVLWSTGFIANRHRIPPPIHPFSATVQRVEHASLKLVGWVRFPFTEDTFIQPDERTYDAIANGLSPVESMRLLLVWVAPLQTKQGEIVLGLL